MYNEFRGKFYQLRHHMGATSIGDFTQKRATTFGGETVDITP